MSCSIIEQLVGPRWATCHRCGDASAVSGTLKQLIYLWEIYGFILYETNLAHCTDEKFTPIYKQYYFLHSNDHIKGKDNNYKLLYIIQICLRLRDINVCVMVYKTTEFIRFSLGKLNKIIETLFGIGF